MEASTVTCRTVQSSLSAYIDREVPPVELQQIRTHLSMCDACRTEESDLRCLKALLTGIPAPDPSPEFEARLIRSIHRPQFTPRTNYVRVAGPVVVFAGIAAVSMFAAMQVFAHPAQVASQQPRVISDVASSVRRDQVYEASATDPLFGAPVLTAADYGR